MSPGSSDVLILPSTAESVRVARRFVLRQLTAWGCPELTDAAALGVSELVTNAVIHTRTPLTLTLRWTPPRLRVELHDQSRSAAIGARTLAAVGGQLGGTGTDEVDAAATATSGRGLLIVASVAAAVGETIADDGKIVWFELELGRSPGAGPAVIIQQHAAAMSSLDGTGRLNGAGHSNGARSEPGGGTVRLLDIPASLAAASDDHLSDLTRELTLDPSAPLADRLLDALAQAGGWYPYEADARERVRAAVAFGNPYVNLALPADVNRLAALRVVADLLDEADDAMRANRLLALPPTTSVRRFRRWILEEIAAQLAGAPPTRPPATLVPAIPASLQADRDGEGGATIDLRDPVHLIARLRRELIARKELLEERAYVAETLQKSLLPPELPEIPGLVVAGRYKPGASDVGGDFYDVFPLRGRHWGFIIGDVCGKGPGAAAKTALARYTLRTAAMLERRPADVLEVLNAALLQRGEADSFCSAVFARLRPGKSGAAGEVVVAGHPRPLLRRVSGEVERLETGGALLGIMDGDVTLRVPVSLRPGDVLVFYTDGVTEARRSGEFFGEDRLVDVVAGAGGSAEEVVGAIEDAVEAFGDHDRADDVAILAISPTE
ncbi:MAG TPA: ATP-binding SpoIIE family protein phosphatase [Acidimicrobiia bacterium]|nr:ATP-binding SpoIIE family protein phosphatase [Acidimicrobiia bacterium]